VEIKLGRARFISAVKALPQYLAKHSDESNLTDIKQFGYTYGIGGT